MVKAQLVDQKIPMTLNEIGKNSNYFSALELKGKTLSKDAKIKDESVEVRAQFFYSALRPFRKLQ
tara:strand:- start:193 stop:387 length:195 start_codon:yes stop_codon:yes gene_type:complete